MDFLAGFPTIGLVAFLLFFSCLLKILKQKISKKKNLLPPRPNGAWPVLGHLPLLRGPKQPHVILANMADKYGPIFSIKTGVHRSLVVSSWELAKECFTTNDKAFANRPNFLAAELMGYNSAMFGFSPYGQYWRVIRKIATVELLSNHRLQSFRHVRESEITAAMNGIYQLWEENIDYNKADMVVKMKQWFGDITLNVIFRIIVGKRYVNYYMTSLEDGNDSDEWREAVNKFFELSGKYVLSDSLPFLRWLDLGGYQKSMKKTAKELDVFVQSWLDEHKCKRSSSECNKKRASGAKTEEDFMDVMLSLLDDSKEIYNRDAATVNKATCMAIILAASDTTKTSLTWTLSLLLNHSDVLKKVKDELDVKIGKERQVQNSDINNLTYFNAVVKEAFRLYPAAALSVPRESNEDCVVGGYHIPAGTRLFVHISKIQRDPRVWENPLEFQPERFLTTHKDVDVKGQHFELIPFGAGRRICPGTTLALQTLNLTLASLLHAFEIETPLGQPVDMTESSGITNLKATPLDVLLTPLLPAHLY
ncbi:cytochrome P450 CYP82D47-like [Jatropha curcas]|uniref:cytochrome P450 CYP82D47-like n=1 Tax=Jatropha curcas TaxID=180498 RepID=UPI00189619E5|nr:cytochrome P450 CYP82D47-like [Jatropha curcas]